MSERNITGWLWRRRCTWPRWPWQGRVRWAAPGAGGWRSLRSPAVRTPPFDSRVVGRTFAVCHQVADYCVSMLQLTTSVLRIHDIFVRIWGSIPTNGCGSGSASGCDADPAIFVSDLQDINNNKIFKFIFSYYFLKVRLHLHHFSKIKNHKEVTKQ